MIVLVTLFAVLSGCDMLPTGCPRTIAEARELEVERETFVGGGRVIRYIPSPEDPEFRGYDVNITTPISPESFPAGTAFLRVRDPLPDVADGDPVLLVGRREGGVVIHPAGCPPLTVVDEDELDQ